MGRTPAENEDRRVSRVGGINCKPRSETEVHLTGVGTCATANGKGGEERASATRQGKTDWSEDDDIGGGGGQGQRDQTASRNIAGGEDLLTSNSPKEKNPSKEIPRNHSGEIGAQTNPRRLTLTKAA